MDKKILELVEGEEKREESLLFLFSLPLPPCSPTPWPPAIPAPIPKILSIGRPMVLLLLSWYYYIIELNIILINTILFKWWLL